MDVRDLRRALDVPPILRPLVKVHVAASATAAPYGGNYLALLHTLKDGAYETLAYEFAGAPPFGITRVSRPIELQGGGAAFPSALLYAQGKVVLAYGVDDASSRALVMSAAYLEELFVQDGAWCNATAR